MGRQYQNLREWRFCLPFVTFLLYLYSAGSADDFAVIDDSDDLPF